MDFYHLKGNIKSKYWVEDLDAVKTFSKKVIHKASQFLKNKTADAVTKSNHDKIVKPYKNPINVKEIINLPEEKRRNMKQIETNIIKMEHYKISKILNDSAVSKIMTKKCIEVNDLSSGLYSVNKNIRLKTSLLRSNLCGYSNAYIVVK